MTISYILQVLQDMKDGKIQDPGYIKDLEWELHKAFRRVRRRVLRLRSRGQYEVGEMDRAKVSAVSGHMEEFTKYCSRVRNFNLKDCEGLPGIETFTKEGFQVDEMIAKADTIAQIETVSSLGFTPMMLGFGILDGVISLPKVKVDNKRFHAMDMEYISSVIEELKNYQIHVRNLTDQLEEIAQKAREEADALNDLHDYFVDGINDVKAILNEKGEDWNRYTQSEKMQIARAIQVAQLIPSLFPHLMDDSTGEVSESSREAIEKARHALNFRDA